MVLISRLTASTLKALQQKPRSRSRPRLRSKTFSRRQGEPFEAEERQDTEGLRASLAEMEKALGLGKGEVTQVDSLLPSHVNYVKFPWKLRHQSGSSWMFYISGLSGGSFVFC